MRRHKRASADKTPQSAPASEAVARDGGDTTRASVTFAVPLASARPSSSTADPSSLFAAYTIPKDQAAAAKEAIQQAGIMMEQVKMAREASQAAYDASSALQSNVQVSRLNTWSVMICCLKSLFQRSFVSVSVHPLGVSANSWTSGGTLSAPTGCSPRDYGGLLAVDCSLYIVLL